MIRAGTMKMATMTQVRCAHHSLIDEAQPGDTTNASIWRFRSDPDKSLPQRRINFPKGGFDLALTRCPDLCHPISASEDYKNSVGRNSGEVPGSKNANIRIVDVRL
jgi:hypothetical protein